MPAYRPIGPAEAAERVRRPGVVVLDVRTAAEFASGHVPGATNVDVQAWDFDERVARLDRAAPILLYCRSGARSAAAGRRMAALGFRDVTDVQGGLLAWHAAGLPLAA